MSKRSWNRDIISDTPIILPQNSFDLNDDQCHSRQDFSKLVIPSVRGGATLCLPLRTENVDEPMSKTNTFDSEYRYDSDFCPKGKFKVCPYTDRW
jgi:hypothetical protein